MILPETAGQKLLVDHGRVVGVRTGDKGRGKDGEPLANFEPGVDVDRADHGARRGDRGPPDHRGDRPLRPPRAEPADLGARRQGGLEGPEAAAADRPHHGLAAAQAGALRRVRRLVDLPDGRGARLARLRRRARVRGRRALRARPAPGVQDAPARPQDPRGRRARRLGREDDHRGRPAIRCRRSSTRRGCCSSARAPGSSTCRGSRACTTRSSRGGSRPRRRSRRCSAARSRGGGARSTATTTRSARATSGRTSPRSGTCARPSTRASSWAARSRAR